ncbi:aerobic-type carbon monoxide dehydrogenase small subunit (CoxS/CutS family) [Virgibacillus halotolerans]|uniref:(2Fe-2S)-binding protein n=1 Tax=Virgibacillus halotolerans TaxID=1071053 RepID=UPI00195FB80A|nr:(2Fe-2S)-binding protein [Virgibacillus halotolerans]MBM7599896.1 aerobic-type carbon monoxide dehydrogenase small subunit (CoxS/CutS family) [Virgibacillus halotolerans]
MKKTIDFTVNNEQKSVQIRSADTLLITLREQLGLTGAKPGCENGDCGACTVLVDDQPMKSCLMLTAETANRSITTIEGLHDTPIQKAFLEHWGFQCGYCTSGFIMNCHALANIHPDANAYEIENWLQSNICRCTGYEEIKEAIMSVLKTKEAGTSG